LDTEKKVREISRFIVLIPHRDSLKPLDEYRNRLFSIGYPGIRSFPAAAPLAAVSKPFNRDELKQLALFLRSKTMENNGKFFTQAADSDFPESFHTEARGTQRHRGKAGDFSFFGPLWALCIDENAFPETARQKILRVFTPPVLCAALLEPGLPCLRERPSEPIMSFRAACLANLAIRPLSAGDPHYSFEWRIGPPLWLPKYIQ